MSPSLMVGLERLRLKLILRLVSAVDGQGGRGAGRQGGRGAGGQGGRGAGEIPWASNF